MRLELDAWVRTTAHGATAYTRGRFRIARWKRGEPWTLWEAARRGFTSSVSRVNGSTEHDVWHATNIRGGFFEVLQRVNREIEQHGNSAKKETTQT